MRLPDNIPSPLLPLEEMASLSGLFRGSAGRVLAKGIKSLLKIDEVEYFYAKICGWDGEKETGATGAEFAKGAIEESGFRMTLNGMPRDEAIGWLRENLPSGAFITISNHTLGALDGLGLIDLFGHAREDYKFMVNKLLMRMKAAASRFITVTPTGAERTAPTADSVAGVRAAVGHLQAGGCLGLFPSGAVSDKVPGRRPLVTLPALDSASAHDSASAPAAAPWGLPATYTEPRIRDREWQMSIIKFIKRAGVPVIPVLDATLNSNFYYNLGLIDWRIRITRLPAEMLNKRGKSLRFIMGRPITPEQIQAVEGLQDLRTLLRASVYSML
ncbi:MAG: 1-acyl-sn-glycerol-3-phosphate acyltransferase [Bacteroidales bacterium]|nr:1-acyl-sn-glycerol-3-phosphate acyltransferase [Bacteroidales bacterium]